MTDQTRTPTLTTVVKAKIEDRLLDVHVALPGRIESYDKDAQLVDVTPLVKRIYAQEDGSDVVEELPVLAAVPVQFPSGGGMRIVLPLKKGDTGWIMFSEASLDAWRARGGLVDPQDDRRFHLSDATFLPGLHAKDAPLTIESGDDASFGKDGAHQVVVTPDYVEIGGNSGSRPNDFVALAKLTNDNFSKLHDAVNQGFSNLRTDLSSISSHVHNVETAGTAVKQSGTTLPSTSLASLSNPQDVGDMGDVKASITKAK